MKKLFSTTAALILVGSAATAAITADQLSAAYQAKGYTAIEVVTGPSQITVDATFHQTRVEVVYDIASGAILSRNQSRADGSGLTHSVEVKAEPHDLAAEGGHEVGHEVGDAKGADGPDAQDGATASHAGGNTGTANDHGAGHDAAGSDNHANAHGGGDD